MDRYFRQVAAVEAIVDRLDADLLWVRKSVEQASRFAQQIKSIADEFSSSFERTLVQDRALTFIQDAARGYNKLLVGVKHHRKAHMLVSAALPTRGWYLSGREPCTLSLKLADAVREGAWDDVDQQVMTHLPSFETVKLREWLVQEGVPECCSDRLCKFLKHQEDGNHEEATYLGVPLLDEIAQYLYCGKSFTTKRSAQKTFNQSKPELGFKTATGPDLASYAKDFVQAFGSLQKDLDPTLLTDENYWNRHAIVHGRMRRGMGVKDSAKCLMAIGFLFFAQKQEEEGN